VRELIDCHIHTEKCGHGTGSVAQMVGAAVFAGLSGIVLTEHLPLPDDLDPTHHLAMPSAEFAGYAAEVQEQAARVRGLQVVLGAEADWLPGREDFTAQTRAHAGRLGVEVLLGSVHFIDDWAFDDPHHLERWDESSVDDVWTTYFSTWCEAASSGLFDVMAHPDLVKKFGHRPTFDTRELYLEAAASAAKGGVLIEVSTGGLRKPVGELYPGPELLSAFHSAGVGATVGSDAHDPSEVGYALDMAYQALSTAGYDRVMFPLGSRHFREVEL
jgi:histidinol-phosphatase (PHP family)